MSYTPYNELHRSQHFMRKVFLPKLRSEGALMQKTWGDGLKKGSAMGHEEYVVPKASFIRVYRLHMADITRHLPTKQFWGPYGNDPVPNESLAPGDCLVMSAADRGDEPDIYPMPKATLEQAYASFRETGASRGR